MQTLQQPDKVNGPHYIHTLQVVASLNSCHSILPRRFGKYKTTFSKYVYTSLSLELIKIESYDSISIVPYYVIVTAYRQLPGYNH